MSGDAMQGNGGANRWNGRVTPHVPAMECGLVGTAMMLYETDPGTVEDLLQQVPDDAFFTAAYRMVWGTIRELHAQRKPVGLFGIQDVLMARGTLPEVGGPSGLTDICTSGMASAWVAKDFAREVMERYFLRSIIATGNEMVEGAFEPDANPAELLDRIQQKLLRLGMERCDDMERMRPIRDGLMDACNQIEATYMNRGSVTGLATGLADLDRMTGGLKGSQFIVIAARPAMGKTALATAIACHAASGGKNGGAVAFFSMEMSFEELATRILCTAADVNLKRVRDGFLSHTVMDSLPAAASRISNWQLYVDDTPALSIQELRRRARLAKQKLGIKLIVIDYIQLMRSTSKRAQENRNLEITEISMGLKQLAKELDIPVIGLAQLSRKVEERPECRPQISDLRESGSLEQDADIVGLLYRQEYYVKNTSKSPNKRADTAEKMKLTEEEWEQTAELIIGKQRNGPVGEVQLRFEKHLAKFSSGTEKLYSNDPGQRQRGFQEEEE